MALEDAVCLAEQAVAAASRGFKISGVLYILLLYNYGAVFGQIYAEGVNQELRNQILSEWTTQGGIDMSWLYSHQPHLPRVETVRCPSKT